jgi:hypothetical protein
VVEAVALNGLGVQYGRRLKATAPTNRKNSEITCSVRLNAIFASTLADSSVAAVVTRLVRVVGQRRHRRCYIQGEFDFVVGAVALNGPRRTIRKAVEGNRPYRRAMRDAAPDPQVGRVSLTRRSPYPVSK